MTTTAPMTILDLRKKGKGHVLLAAEGPLGERRLRKSIDELLRGGATEVKNDPSLSYIVVPWSETGTDALRSIGKRHGLTRAWLFDQTSSFMYSASRHPEQVDYGDENLSSTGRPETWLTMLLHIVHFAKNYDEALRIAEAIPVHSFIHRRRLGLSLAGACSSAVRAGKKPLSLALAERGQELGSVCPTVHHAAARAFEAAGQRDRALEQVQKAAEWHYHFIASETSSANQDMSIERDPALAGLCREPRFKAFLERLTTDMAAFAKAWRSLRSKPAKAIATFEALAASDSPIARGAFCNLASAYKESGNADKAKEVTRAGLERFKDWRLLDMHNAVCLSSGRHTEVAAHIAKYANDIPDSDDLFVTVTYGALESGAFDLGCAFVLRWVSRYGTMSDVGMENAIQLFSLTRRLDDVAHWLEAYQSRYGGTATGHAFAALAAFARGDLDATIELGTKARQLEDTIFETKLDTPTKKMLRDNRRIGAFLRRAVAPVAPADAPHAGALAFRSGARQDRAPARSSRAHLPEYR